MPKNLARQTKTARRAERARESLRIHFPIVGIGASAGGLDACKKFVKRAAGGNRHGLHPGSASRSDT